MGRCMTQGQHFKCCAHFRHFADFADIEGRNAHATTGFGNHKSLRFQSAKGFAHGHMACFELFGDMILTEFDARLDLARNNTVGENTADAGGNGFAGSVI